MTSLFAKLNLASISREISYFICWIQWTFDYKMILILNHMYRNLSSNNDVLSSLGIIVGRWRPVTIASWWLHIDEYSLCHCHIYILMHIDYAAVTFTYWCILIMLLSHLHIDAYSLCRFHIYILMHIHYAAVTFAKISFSQTGFILGQTKLILSFWSFDFQNVMWWCNLFSVLLLW